MTELKVPAVTIELSINVYAYLPIEHRAFGDDGLDAEPVDDPSLIYVASDEGLMMSFSYTSLIDNFIEHNKASKFPVVDKKVKKEVVALRNYLIKQAEKLNQCLPGGDPDRIVNNTVRE